MSGVAAPVALMATATLATLALRPVRAASRRRGRARLAGPDAVHPRFAVAPGSLAIGGSGLVTAWVVAGPTTTAALTLTAAAIPLAERLRRQATARHERDRQMPGALDGLATALRSGASLTQALRDVGDSLDPPLGPEVTAVARAAERGRPLHEVLDEWSSAHDDAGTRLAATALVLATLVGSAPARAVDGVAATLRERLDLAAERRALAVQARTSALVLSVAPVGFAVLLVVGDTAAAGFLLGTPAGWACLGVGLALDVAGAWWMTRLSRSDGW